MAQCPIERVSRNYGHELIESAAEGVLGDCRGNGLRLDGLACAGGHLEWTTGTDGSIVQSSTVCPGGSGVDAVPAAALDS